MQDRDKLIERIRKLLAVTEGRGATEAEAIAAALAAQKLMAENNVEQWELAEGGEPIVEVESRKKREWHGYLAITVAENFRCRCYIYSRHENGKSRRTPYMVFIGYRPDAEAAKLVYERLADIGGKKANEFANKRRLELTNEHVYIGKKPLFDNFASNFVDGVRSVLEKQSQALMIVCPKKVDEAFKDATAGCSRHSWKMNRYGNEGADAGFKAGRDAVMSGRIAAGKSERLLAV